MTLPDRDAVSRRTFLRAAVAAGGASALSACLGESEELSAPEGGDPDALPERQHAWNDALARDEDGNERPPEHHVLLSLDLVDDAVGSGGAESGDAGASGEADAADDPVDADAREQVETALRSVERAIAWDSEGLLFTVGYTPAYFDRFDAELPESVDLPAPEALTALENPETLELDTADAVVHLASDEAAAVVAAEEALLGEETSLNGREMDATFEGVFEEADRRSGFVGPGKPAEKQREEDLGNMPQSEIPEDAPFFMGFRSGFRESQATEDRVTIDDGPFAGGTTEHVESLRLQLRSWFDQDSQAQRVQKMFSPAHAASDAAEAGESADGDGGASDGDGASDGSGADAADVAGADEVSGVGQVGEALSTASGAAAVADLTEQHARTAGVVGHAQKAARAREDGQPLLLRRDFDTIDGDFPGVHFLSLQSSISEFVRVREAMAGEDLTDAAVGRRTNNGILEYLTVLRRGNALVPPREHRALPTPKPGREQ